MIIEAPPGKKITFLYDQRLDAEPTLDITFVVHEAGILDAQMIFCGRSSNCNLKISMLGSRGQATLRGAYFLSDDQKFELNVVQEHKVGNTESHVTLKGALAGRAHVSYTGTIKIEEQASHSNASQENKNILLSEHARAVSVPNLEALTNEVQCAHGSAVGQLDEEQLLYLQTRGIPYERAKKVLLTGFFADIVSADVDLEQLLDRVL